MLLRFFSDRSVGVEIRIERPSDFVQLQKRLAEKGQFRRHIQPIVSGTASEHQNRSSDINLFQPIISLLRDEMADRSPEFVFIEFLRRFTDIDG